MERLKPDWLTAAELYLSFASVFLEETNIEHLLLLTEAREKYITSLMLQNTDTLTRSERLERIQAALPDFENVLKDARNKSETFLRNQMTAADHPHAMLEPRFAQKF